MTNTGCLNLRGKDGSQSSITVRGVYLPASFFNACSSDYLRTERLFLQRPFASQMVSPVFSHFAAVLLEIRNIAFLKNVKGKPSTSDRKSLIGNRRDHYDFMRVLPRVKRFRAENHCCSSLLCSDSLFVFFLRPPFMRKVREWTDKEFFLYSLLVILLLGIAFIIFKVLESGSKLFCSI